MTAQILIFPVPVARYPDVGPARHAQLALERALMAADAALCGDPDGDRADAEMDPFLDLARQEDFNVND